MKLLTSKVFWGLILVIGGVILLLESMGILEGSEVFWMAACAVAGILFVVALLSNRGAWWAAIPGVSLLAIALGLGLETFANPSGEMMGAVILGGIGLSFIIVYLLQPMNWWAIIPGGVLITLAIVAGMESSDPGLISGAIFFAGLGLTFALVALLPNKVGRMSWAWIPAGILLLLAILILAGIESLINYIWPVVIIAVGLYVLLRTFIKRSN
jgi:hypothetical protein